jgi:Fe-S oxidoreductase
METKFPESIDKAVHNPNLTGQTCCGAPARYSGAYGVAAQNANDNINALLANDVTYVVSACPTCTVALKHNFISTFESLGQTDSLPRAR